MANPYPKGKPFPFVPNQKGTPWTAGSANAGRMSPPGDPVMQGGKVPPAGTAENNYKKTGYSREQIGLTDQEKADARKISTAPSQSISSNPPGDMCIVNICEPVGDLGEKKSSDRDIT